MVIADTAKVADAERSVRHAVAPGNAAYTASKHGVVGLTKNAAAEYGAAGLRINSVGPGCIMTPLLIKNLTDEVLEVLKTKHPLGRLGRPMACWSAMDDIDAVLARAGRGSPEAFTELYQHLVRPVAGYLRSKGVLDVEDVTSDVFLAVFSGIGTFDGDGEHFRSWVFTIAHRRSVDYWRRTGRSPQTEPLEPTDDGGISPSAEALALARIGDQQAIALLDDLSADQREVLLLRVIGDLTVEQAAEVLGKTAGAVKALQHRGLARLRRLTRGVTL